MRRYEVNIVLNPNLDQSQLALEKEIIQRALRQAAALRKTIGGIERVARRIKRMIERAFTALHRPRDCMIYDLSDTIILKEKTRIGLHYCAPSFISGLYAPSISFTTA